MLPEENALCQFMLLWWNKRVPAGGVAQYDFAGFHITGEKVFDALAEKSFAKARIASYARPDCFLKISCQSHWSYLSVYFRSW
jgi:hypothetical protein